MPSKLELYEQLVEAIGFINAADEVLNAYDFHEDREAWEKIIGATAGLSQASGAANDVLRKLRAKLFPSPPEDSSQKR